MFINILFQLFYFLLWKIILIFLPLKAVDNYKNIEDDFNFFRIQIFRKCWVRISI